MNSSILHAALRGASVIALLMPAAQALAASTLACPVVAKAVQVGTCPTEEDLRYTYHGFCSDNQRMYDRKTEGCIDYRQYREMKNTALWESADGEFQAYLSCETPAAARAAARAVKVAVSAKGGITQVICTYDQGFSFTRRSRDRCTAGPAAGLAAECAADPAACTVSCEQAPARPVQAPG